MGEGRDTSTQKAQQLNIKAAIAVASTVRSTLGPLGMDKMCVDQQGHFIVSNDGASILRELDVAHPGAQMVVNMSKTQEAECKDGTTSVVVLAGKLLDNALGLLSKGIHPNIICKGYRNASRKCLDELPNYVLELDEFELESVAKTAITGKAAEHDIDNVARLCVEAVERADGDDSKIKVVSQIGGSLDDSHLYDGVILNKQFSSTLTTGGEGKVLLLNTGLTPPPMHDSMRVQLGSMEAVQQFQMAETRMLVERARAIVELGVNTVFVRDSVHEAVIHTLAQAGIGIITRVPQTDLEAISKLTGSPIYHMTEDADPEKLQGALVKENLIGDTRFVSIQANDSTVATLVLRGATRQTIDELERAFDDAIGVVAIAYNDRELVPGGGAVYISLANKLVETSDTRLGLAEDAFYDSLYTIPTTIAENAGHDPLDTLLRLKKATVGLSIDIETGGLDDMAKAGIIEPARVIRQAIQSATEVAIAILRIDDIIGKRGESGQDS
jgi:archaeal chaperonin